MAAFSSWRSVAASVTVAPPIYVKPPPREDEPKKQAFVEPHRPSAMCEEQRIDFIAACERKITWYQYFAKWGRQGLSL